MQSMDCWKNAMRLMKSLIRQNMIAGSSGLHGRILI